MVFEGFEYGAARLVGVGAVGETAVFGEMENLLEIAGKFLGLHVESAEALDARRVHYPPSALQGNHLGERGGVLAGVVGIGDLGRAEIGTWHEAIDKGGLPHPAVAAEEGDLTWQQGL